MNTVGNRISKLTTLALVAALTVLTGSSWADVTIIVNPGSLGSVEEAAVAEEKTEWWDGDLSDDNACTESFAATELKHFIAAVTDLEESDITLAAPGGALPTLHAATAPDVKGGEYFGPGGFGGMTGPPERARSSPRSRNAALAGRLWQVSEQRTGVAFLD